MSVIYRKRLRWHAVATAITASTTPPADADINGPDDAAGPAAPSDTAGIYLPDHVGEDVAIMAELTTAGGTPSMTVAVYGFVRTYTAQDGTLATDFGASAGQGRWVFLDYLNGGTAIDTTNNPENVPAANTLTWVENFKLGAQYERIHIQLWASGGTTPTLDTYVGWAGGE